ncbi:MAG: carboxypeptidase regulatory-like domain-containing protein [Anaerolineales bacterium]|nr:carboxypeptidase regulatory-like domain-containing protein [Anaerolineales bacterium]
MNPVNEPSTKPFPFFIALIFIPIILIIATLGLLNSQSVKADNSLSVEINTAYNLVVDSNASSPSTYAPRAATVYGTFCNKGTTNLTDVYGYIGNYVDGANDTPGIYPARNSLTDAAFQTGGPLNYLYNTGSYAFTHIGGAIGTADATRYIGELAVGQCKVQYWHFTYPACANDSSGNPVEPPCSTTPTWGPSVKAVDDLSLSFDMWATGKEVGTGTAHSDNKNWTMTMRNEISAMANKIMPNPDGLWFNTDTETIVPGQVITTNGVLYALGNIRQGFDNDGNYTPDYNAWLQPFGDASYDPSCFRLIRTSTVLTVTRGAGQPNLIVNANDLTPDPTYGGPLFFTNLPSDNNGVRGEVRYTFLALTGPCSVPISPYQEVASGSDNEKFNGDFGAGIPTVQSSTPEVTISKSGSPGSVAVNNLVIYDIPFINTSATYAAGLTLNNGGINMPLVVRDSVPEGLQYEGGTAGASFIGYTSSATIRYSTDGGTTWSTSDPGNTLSAAPNTVVIEWWLNDPVPVGGSGSVTFQARVPGTYLTGGGKPIIENEACANFGGGTDFACDTAHNIVAGNNSVGDYVWADVNTDGLQAGESGIPGITVWLYGDVNGDGLQDDGDILIATISTGLSGGYSFGSLPDGHFLVVVDSEDPDLPIGYANTTPAVISVPLDPSSATMTAVNVTTADFGFGPVLGLTKTLTSANPAYEGEDVTFDLTLTNNLPSGPSDEYGRCSYTYWATGGAAQTVTSSGGNAWLNPGYVAGGGVPAGAELNGSEAYATFTNGNTRYIRAQQHALAPSAMGKIERVEVVYYGRLSTNLGTGESARGRLFTVGAAYNSPSYTSADYTQTQLNPLATAAGEVVWDVTALRAWSWSDFTTLTWQILWEISKSGGGSASTMYLDSMGFRITTNQLCGGSSSIIDPLPLTDSYDASKLEFVSTTPLQNALASDTTPYANTGVISWDNLGPLAAGESKTVQVTFLALEPPSNLQTSTINYAAVNGAAFVNGRPTNQPADDDPVTITPTGSIGDTVWNDNGAGSGGIAGNGIKDGSEQGIAGVTVRLTASTNVTINGVTYTAGSVIMTAVTDANGNYLFEGLPDATYTVTVDNTSLPGMTPIYDADGIIGTPHRSTTTISGANDDLDQDFGYNIPIIIYGHVWQDFNGNGSEDSDDEPVANVDVTLYRWDGSAWQPVATLQTDSNGDYLFDSQTYSAIVAGDYYVATNPSTLPVGPTWVNTYDPDGDLDDASGTAAGVDAIVVVTGEMSGSHDFGYHQTGAYSISGNVYADWDSDADFNNNDAGFGGIGVTLYSSTGAVIATTTTNPDGSYTFSSLPSGNYTVVVDETGLPAQYSETEDWDESPGACTICDGRGSVTIPAGGPAVTDVDFGYEPSGYGAIGDFVWQDTNGDGYQASSEPGLPNITVNLYVDYGDGDGYVLVDSMQTGPNGFYLFTNLPPGDYRAEVDTAVNIPTDSYGSDYVLTTASSFDVALGLSETYLDADFGFAPGGAIGDTVYWDANRNAEQDWNETGISGVPVTLEVWNGASWVFYASDTTDLDGLYLFTSLPSGQYRVVVDTGAGSPVNGRTLTGDPDTNGIPCDPDPGAPWTAYCDNQTEALNLRPGQTYLGADFGYVPTGVIGDFVWLDGNSDGIQNAGEPGIANVTVTLDPPTGVDLGNGDGVAITTVTDPDGYYSFANVPDATYDVSFATPSGTIPTTTGAGSQSVGTTTTVVISGGVVTTIGGSSCTDCDLDIDSGFVLNGAYALSGTVFYDLNQNGGDQESGELGYSGQTVYLWQLGGSSYVLVGSTTTDANGDYSFTNLPNGSYIVSTDGTSTNLNNAAHTTGSSNQNTGTVYETATINNANVEDVDFGFFLGTDFDDLPNSYNTNLSAGAYHINTGLADTLRLGPGIDLEPNGAPDPLAALDSYDDGVIRDTAYKWSPNTTVPLNITVSGGTGVVGAWFDWNDDGDFIDPGEFVSFGTLNSGTHTVSLDIPSGYTVGQPVYARFRVFDPATIPGGTLTADDYLGRATGGEVEGYRWLFGVTAVSLKLIGGSSQHLPLTTLGAACLFVMLALGFVLIHRRRTV